MVHEYLTLFLRVIGAKLNPVVGCVCPRDVFWPIPRAILETAIRLSEPISSTVRLTPFEFVALWRSWRTDGLLPGRNDFDVFEVRPWIGRILMMDVIDGGQDFQYRLVGTELVEVRRDLSGRLVSECDMGGIARTYWTSAAPLKPGPVFGAAGGLENGSAMARV